MASSMPIRFAGAFAAEEGSVSRAVSSMALADSGVQIVSGQGLPLAGIAQDEGGAVGVDSLFVDRLVPALSIA